MLQKFTDLTQTLTNSQDDDSSVATPRGHPRGEDTQHTDHSERAAQQSLIVDTVADDSGWQVHHQVTPKERTQDNTFFRRGPIVSLENMSYEKMIIQTTILLTSQIQKG